MTTYTIGELAKTANVPTTTVRYYERAGLLKPEGRTGSGYRSYGSGSLERLLFIRKAQGAGLSLDDVSTLIGLTDTRTTPCEEVQTVLRQRLEEIDHRLGELRAVKKAVTKALRECKCSPRAGLCGDVGRLGRT